jgi:hypothetical protein
VSGELGSTGACLTQTGSWSVFTVAEYGQAPPSVAFLYTRTVKALLPWIGR